MPLGARSLSVLLMLSTRTRPADPLRAHLEVIGSQKDVKAVACGQLW
jgi:hypothetical protein